MSVEGVKGSLTFDPNKHGYWTSTTPMTTWTVTPEEEERTIDIMVVLRVVEYVGKGKTTWCERRVRIPIEKLISFDLNAEAMAMVEDAMNLAGKDDK